MRHRLLTAALLAALTALPACIGLRGRPAPQLSLPGGASAGVVDGLPAWWEALGDSALNATVVQALRENPDLDVLAARVEEARELRRAQRARALPAGDLTAGWQQGRYSDRETDFRTEDVDPWTGTSTFSWEIDLFGRIEARRRAAREVVEQRTAAWYGGQLTLSSEVAAVWLTRLRLNEERRIVAELEQASQDVAGTLQDRKKAGVASAVEADRQEAETETLRRAVLEIDRQRSLASANLDRLLGSPPGNAPEVSGGLSDRMRIPNLPDTIRPELVRHRPDLTLAEAEVQEAWFREEANRLDLYPSLSLEFDGALAAGSLTGPVTSWLAAGGPEVRFPALNPVARAEARAARARTDAAIAHWESTFLDALEELETAVINFNSHRLQLESAKRETSRLKSVWDQTQANFNAGIVSHLEVLEDQRRYLAVRRTQLALYHQVLLDYVDLTKAAGGKL